MADKVVVLTLQDGTKVPVKLQACTVGDKVVVLNLQDGTKVAVKIEDPVITD